MNQPEVVLSIVIPFYNSALKCKRLLSGLASLTQPFIELILVDDGSTDNTFDIICEFKEKAKCTTFIIKQENKGPGGARNQGLKFSRGKYVWFVDSDDEINPRAIDVLKAVATENYDFLDFNILTKEENTSSIDFVEGAYLMNHEVKLSLLSCFGRICSKLIRRNFLLDNSISYPEYCVFEDNYFALILPFHVKKFYKSEVVAYIHHEDFDSITRRNYIDAQYYDRLATVSLGFRSIEEYLLSNQIRNVIEEKFIKLFLINTANSLMTRKPSLGWLMTMRVISYYRSEAKALKIKTNPFKLVNASKAYCSVLRLLWTLSFLLPNQESYFERLHYKAWGMKINL